MSKSAKQNMLEHILRGSNNPGLHIIKIHWIQPATIERKLHCGNWSNIYTENHRRHRRLKDTISWRFKCRTIFKSYQDISWIRPFSHLYQSEIKFYRTYLPPWNIELVWLESKKISIMSPLAHGSSSLTNEILVPNCSKAQDQQTLHYQCIQH